MSHRPDTLCSVDVLSPFTDATREWFRGSFAAPTSAQRQGWPAIATGDHTLIHAPTGSGKTLAAFLWALDRLLYEDLPDDSARCRVLYVSPLKALAHDVDRNLRAPLAGIRHAAARSGGAPPPELRTFIRTGDTPADARRRMLRHPPDILITTPESLYLLLTSQAREVLTSVRWVIVDEVHAVAGSKRGSHLALSLERLEEVAAAPPQRIGLSATQRPLTTIARFLGGGTVGPDGVWVPRPVTIVDASSERPLEVELVGPAEDMTAPPPPDPLDPADPKAAGTAPTATPGGIWEAIYPRILELVEAHDSTIVFANSRRLAERICSELNLLAGREIARAHHGSVAREQRIAIEEALKGGELQAVVATSSLELGIDMGAVDLVVQVEAPMSVASGLQRVGRAGHRVGAVARAKVFPKHRGDLLVATVVVDRMLEGKVEETRIPRNPLDVLAQQLVAEVAVEERHADQLYEMVRRAAPYAELTRPLFDATLEMLAGRYPSDLFAELRPRLVWDRTSGIVSPRRGARLLAVANAGTIPDRGLYRVVTPGGGRVGELDEEMVYESRVGDVFLLGSSTWQITAIGPDQVEVVPTPAASAATPFWHGDMMGRHAETGAAIGAFVRELTALPPPERRRLLIDRYHLDEYAAANLVAYLEEERTLAGVVADDRTLVLERFRDEIGDWRLVLLSPYGARVHAPWAMALRARFRRHHGLDVDVMWSDDGIVFRFPETEDLPGVADFTLAPDEAEELLTDHVADTALFAARFREAAGRALLLPRRRPGARTPLWLQRRRASDLLAAARQFADFPILLETLREVLADDFDLPALRGVLADLHARRIRLVEVDVHRPSPFATSLLFAFVASYLYEGDTPLAERKAAALTLDRRLLSELLGEAELWELLDPRVIEEVELELQHLAPGRSVRGPDGIHDLLRRLGPLDRGGIEARVTDTDLEEALADLQRSHRIVELEGPGGPRWAAIEDMGRLRDALGIPPPPGVPSVFLEPVADPLGDVVGRYARTHGPFAVEVASRDLGLPPAVVATSLHALESQGRVTRGGARRGEWVDSEVLRRLKRRSLAVLRQEIEPVPPDALGRFLPAWQGMVESPPSDEGSLVELLGRLQGAVVPASVLESDVLGSRHRRPAELLDRLMAEGRVVWVGRGSLGPRDGRVSLFLREQASLFLDEAPDPPDGPHHQEILECLRRRGAAFFADLYQAAGGGDPEEVVEALWDLVWAGLVTNDTLLPLRAYLTRRRQRRAGRIVPSSFPPCAAGRWSLTADLLDGRAAEERAVATARSLLARHGVLTRSAVAYEGIAGGFSALYPILATMEEQGRVRRGYFIEGLGGAQFAVPGAVDRLRTGEATGIVALAATDPANPYGAALSWPEVEEGRLARVPGAHVILAEGALVAVMEGRRLRTLAPDPDLYAPVAAAVARIGARHRRVRLDTVNGSDASASPLAAALAEVGFVPTPRGLALRGR